MNVTLQDDRLPVWDALSEFFLDVELDLTDYERIATVLAGSEYSLRQIEEILMFEVYPECKWNMFCVAGEWAGFNPDWIQERMRPRKDKRPRFRIRPLHQWMFKDHWEAVSKRIQEKRKKNES